MVWSGVPEAAPPPRRGGGVRRALAVVAVLALAIGLGFALTGTLRDRGVLGGGTPSGRVTPTTPLPVPSGAEDLATFYSQTLSWQKCTGGECAALTVPLDYAAPTGKTIAIALLRVPARSGSARGSIVVNPGGPGGSGVDFAKLANTIVGRSVRDDVDIVGFDPRGVARSAPIRCLDDAQMDTYLGGEPTPDTPAEELAFLDSARAFGQACAQRNPDVIGHVSTVEVAKDMDVLRAALREEKLSYLGMSYGTLLGATYAGLFPTRVGRMVLDGVVAPDLTSAEVAKGQAVGFDRATRAYVESCVSEGKCPLGESVDAALTAIQDFLARVDATPLPVSGDPRVTELTEGWASMGIAVAMYDQTSWPVLTDALASALRGDGTALQRLANYYADRSTSGTYSGNMLQAISAVNCLDQSDTADLAAIHAHAVEYAAAAPLWGRFLAWGEAICGVWPVPATSKPAPVHAPGSAPIVVVGTTRDPATIYEWAVQLRKQLDNAVLLTFEGDGHTAYQRGSSCINSAIDDYFVDGTVPKDGLRCTPD